MTEEESQSTGGLEVEELDCEEGTAAVLNGEAEAPSEEAELSAEDQQALESAPDGEDWPPDLFAGGGLGAPGGGWGGATAPVNRAEAIGQGNGLQVTSRKRSSGEPTSDHHTSQKRSDAVDLSNGSSPTPQMDRTAAQIAALLGTPNWQGGNLRTTMNGYRVQLLYKTNIGGNHFNHVHVGVRMEP
jgi:hypothetical protein